MLKVKQQQLLEKKLPGMANNKDCQEVPGFLRVSGFVFRPMASSKQVVENSETWG